MKRLLLFLLFLSAASGAAQEKDDPTVGLVLSGGGAKGLAHIGALKVIEEAGVQIDYIGGTSMGAIIGSLYAAGYSAHELDSIFHTTSFNTLIQDQLPRSAKTFYEREYDEKYAITLPFDGFNLSFPSGLSKGQNLYNMLSRLMHHLEGKTDFDKLPIPFFCVAADIETGEEVVLDSGSLPLAVSASAAIPTVFSPVIINDRLLTDGGIFNNYPVEELRRRGADIIIGVDVQDTLRGRDELGSVFEILTQISNFSTIQDMREKRGKTDVYIAPPIAPFNVMSFERGQEIIEAGEKAARERFSELKEVTKLQAHQQRSIGEIPAVDSLYIADVRFKGKNTYPDEYILGKLHLEYPSKISYEDLKFGINNLSATGNFNRINYELLPINGSFVLEMELEENPNKTFLRMGIHYDEFYKSAALINLTRKSLLFTNDVTSLDVVLGDNFRYNFEYFWDKGYYWSFGLKSRYSEFKKNVAVDFADNQYDIKGIDINSISLDYSDLTNQLYFETVVRKKFRIRIGAEHKYLNVFSETIGNDGENSIPSTVFDKSHYFSGFGSLHLDTYDNKYFPSKGFYLEGDFHMYLFSSNYNDDFTEFSIAKGKIGHAFRISPKLSARIQGASGFRIGNNDNNSFNFFLGGYGNEFDNNIVPFYGYEFLDLSGDSFLKGLIELDYEIFSKNHIIASANAAFVEDDLYSDVDGVSNPDFSGYALGYGLETFFGPLEVKYTYSPDVRNSHWFFSLGFWF